MSSRRRSARARSTPERGAAERVQKVLASLGLASRRQAEAWIRAGRLTLNGVPATLGARAAPGDELRLDGRIVHVGPRRGSAAAGVYLCHRSPGEPLTPAAAEGVAQSESLIDRLPRRAGRRFIAVSPMPRIDGGLELVTADGALAARLQRAVHALPSQFSVRVLGELGEGQLQGIAGGELDRGVALAVEGCENSGGAGLNRWYLLRVRGASGKDVRQLFERQGARVSRVLRTGLGPVLLERALGRGRARLLDQEELAALLGAAGAESGCASNAPPVTPRPAGPKSAR